MSRVDLTLDEAADALSAIPSDDRETWVAMGMALKSEFGEAAFGVWDEWSATAGNYEAAAAKTTWKSIKAGGRTTLGTLIAKAKECGHQFKAAELSAGERRRRKDEVDARRRALEKVAEEDEKARAAWQVRIAEACKKLVSDVLSEEGASPYLDAKRVRSFGLLFVERALVVAVCIAQERVEIHDGGDQVQAFFAARDAGKYPRDEVSFRYFKRGTTVVPLKDERGELWSLQFIYPEGKKTFLKFSRKAGLFHALGRPGPPGQPIAIAEGYATAATIIKAMGWQTLAAIDAGNLMAVAKAVRKRYPQAVIVVCGDNDVQTKGNPGLKKAQQAAKAVNGIAVVPEFREAA